MNCSKKKSDVYYYLNAVLFQSLISVSWSTCAFILCFPRLQQSGLISNTCFWLVAR